MPIGNAFAIIKSVKVKVPMVESFASVSEVFGLACDSNNNIFASSNYLIYKVDTNKTVSQFADLREIPNNNDTGPSISYIDTDPDDNIYISDGIVATIPNLIQYHFNIKKITPSGTITKYLTGAGATTGIFLNNFQLFFSEITNNQVRVFNQNQSNSVGFMSTLKAPRGIAMDSSGNVYVADSGNHVIYKYASNPFGNKIVYAGRSSTAGYLNSYTLTDSLFNQPMGICFDKYDNLYIADQGNHSIRKITKNGVISTLIGNTAGDSTGFIKDVKLRSPTDVLIGKDECLYIADRGNSRIKKLDFNA